MALDLPIRFERKSLKKMLLAALKKKFNIQQPAEKKHRSCVSAADSTGMDAMQDLDLLAYMLECIA